MSTALRRRGCVSTRLFNNRLIWAALRQQSNGEEMLDGIVILLSCAAFWAAWKTFEWFKWSHSEAFYASKWAYYKKKIGFSFGSFILVLVVGGTLVAPDKHEVDKSTSAEVQNTHPTGGTSKAEALTSSSQQLEITAKQEQQSAPSVSVAAEPEFVEVERTSNKKYTDEEIQKLEDAVQYHGNDPIIRARLGLPPKE